MGQGHLKGSCGEHDLTRSRCDLPRKGFLETAAGGAVKPCVANLSPLITFGENTLWGVCKGPEM